MLRFWVRARVLDMVLILGCWFIKVNQYEILRKVLGDRSDYQRGVGYKGKARKTASSSSSQSQAQSHPSHFQYSDEDFTIMATMMKQLRDSLMTSPQQSLRLQNPLFNQLLEKISEGGTSSQGAANLYLSSPQSTPTMSPPQAQEFFY